MRSLRGSIIKYLRTLGAQNLKSSSAHNSLKGDMKKPGVLPYRLRDSEKFWRAAYLNRWGLEGESG